MCQLVSPLECKLKRENGNCIVVFKLEECCGSGLGGQLEAHVDGDAIQWVKETTFSVQWIDGNNGYPQPEEQGDREFIDLVNSDLYRNYLEQVAKDVCRS